MVSLRLAAAVAAVCLASAAAAAEPQPQPQAETLRRYPAAEANQGVAVDARYFYAVDDSALGKYDRATGERVAVWTGDPKAFPHINSCAVIGAELVCAASNYPALPMSSSVEVFDPERLAHLKSIPLGPQPGSITWITRGQGSWWATFANYDGRGGTPGRDHRYTVLVQLDDGWRTKRSWTFPASVLERIRPHSISGGVWGADGRLYVTGHDAAEVYVLRLPRRGGVAEHMATIAAPIQGQAIARDPIADEVLFGIQRATREVVAMKLPKLPVD